MTQSIETKVDDWISVMKMIATNHSTLRDKLAAIEQVKLCYQGNEDNMLRNVVLPSEVVDFLELQ